MKYFLRRQNPLKETVSEEQMDDLFRELIVMFDKKWLELEGDHVLQRLWRRKDALSTNELFTLASSIKNLNSIDSSWVSHQVDQILSENVNNQKGAFFELIGLNSLITQVADIKPAPKNQRGIDREIQFKDGGAINLSIKNYGLSYHHESFLKESNNFKEILKNSLKSQGVQRVQVFIDSPHKYPSSEDWAKLTAGFPNTLRKFNGTFIQDEIDAVWQITLSDIADINYFHPRHSSYTLILTSIYHKNEQQNLITKMDSAASKLSSSRVRESCEDLNFIFFRLPLTISANNCIRWANDYFANFPNDPISGALFYQTAVVSDIHKGTSFISHFLKPVLSNKYFEWLKNHPKSKFAFSFPVGVPIKKPSSMVVTNGKEKMLTIDERHIFQCGEHYVKARTSPGGFEGDIRHLGPGLQQYCVLEVEGKNHIIGGHFGDDLLIL